MNRFGEVRVTNHPARTFLALLATVVMVLSGCASSSPAQQDSQTERDNIVGDHGRSRGTEETVPTETNTHVDLSSDLQSIVVDVPGPEEICLTPDDKSGIAIYFGKPQGHGLWRMQPGWTVAHVAEAKVVHVEFPQPVDPSTVRVRVEPEFWQIAEYEYGEVLETRYDFRLIPDEKIDPANWIGWVTLTVEQATAAEGSLFDGVPFSIRFFAFDRQLADAHPHLTECMSRLVVHVDP